MTDTSSINSLFQNIDPNAFDQTASNLGQDAASGMSLSDLASAFSTGASSMSSLFGGGSSGANPASPVSTGNFYASSANDPSTQAADTSYLTNLASGQTAPTAAQGTQGQNQQGQNQNANQFAPQSAVDQLKKALTGLKQQQRQNPWQIGGPNTGPNQWRLNQAGQINTGGVPPMPAQPSAPARGDEDQANLPSPDAQNVMAMQTQGQGGYDPTAVMGDEGPAPGDPTQAPPWFRWAGGRPFGGQPWGDTDIPNMRPPPAGGGGATPAPAGSGTPAGGGTAPSVQPPQGGRAGAGIPVPGSANDPNILSSLPWLARQLGLYGLGGPAMAGTMLLSPQSPTNPLGMESTEAAEPGVTPSEAGLRPPGSYSNYRPEDDPQAPSSNVPIGGGEGNRMEAPTGSVAKAPDTGKPVKTVDPKTGDPVDPKTGDPLPTKKGDAQSPYMRQIPQPNAIQRDASGMQSAPTMLGDIARMVMPLLMSGLMGGFGGRGRRGGFGGFRGGFRGGGRGFHPGGFGGHWPYHSPTQGWRLHGGNPGGDFRPMDPRHMREIMADRFGRRPLGYGPDGNLGTGNPELDQFLAQLGFGGGNQNQVGFGANRGNQNMPSYNPYYDKGSRYRQPGQPSSTVTGKGPNGQPLPYTGQDVANFTTQVATGLGMDPNVAKRIIAGESSYGQNYTNDHERNGYPSYGPMQFNMAPGAVGDQFVKQTGLDPRDPSTFKDQIVFGLKWAKANGWGAWGAARDAGIPHWAGINQGGGDFAWNYGKEGGGRTQTGASIAANPDGGATASAAQ